MLPAYRTILCCHSLGPRAQEVLAHAFSMARAFGAEVVVAHSVEPISPQVEQLIANHLPGEPLAELRRNARKLAAEEIEGQIRDIHDGAGPKHLREVQVVEGHTADTLLEAAREVKADLIVMGAHRHSSVGELLLGSTAHRVVQRSMVPVLLVRLAD